MDGGLVVDDIMISIVSPWSCYACLHGNKDGKQFKLVDMETLLHDTFRKLRMEKFLETNYAAAGKTNVCGEKVSETPTEMLQEKHVPLQIRSYFSCMELYFVT